jgi:hypothetical protein
MQKPPVRSGGVPGARFNQALKAVFPRGISAGNTCHARWEDI